MSRYKQPAKKIRLAKLAKRSRWAPFWTGLRMYGSNRQVHPGRHTHVKRSWRRGKTKV